MSNLTAILNLTNFFNASNICNLSNTSSTEVLYVICMLIVLLISLTGNALVVIAVIMSPGIRKKVSSMLISSLACSDFIYAAMLIPFRISVRLYHSRFCHGIDACYWYIISDAFVNTASILNLLMLAIDRYAAIKYPLRYQKVVTKSRTKKAIVFTWLLAGLWSALGTIRWDSQSEPSIYIREMCQNNNKIFYLVSFLGIYLSSLVLMTCIYVNILYIALSHIRAIEKNNTPKNSEWKGLDVNGRFSPETRHRKSSNKRRKREMKTTKSIAIIYGAFVICWLPSMVIVLITYLDASSFQNFQKKNKDAFLFVYYAFIEVLPVLNCTMNPFIYSFSNKQFRKAFKRVFFKIVRKRLPSNLDASSFSFGSSRKKKDSLASMFNSVPRLSQMTKRSQNNNGVVLNKAGRGWSQTSLVNGK